MKYGIKGAALFGGQSFVSEDQGHCLSEVQ